MERIQQILGKSKYANSVNSDFGLKIGLSSTSKILPENEINYIVNVAKQFNKERQSCSKYRISGNITPNFTNVLFNIDEISSLALDNTNKSYTLVEQNGWFGYYDVNSEKLCDFKELTPNRDDFTLIPSTQTKNWDINITYSFTADTTHNLVNNGLLVVRGDKAYSSGKEILELMTPVKHNLVVGDTVRISGLGNNNGDYVVIRLGEDDGNNSDYVFVIDLPYVGIGSNTRIKRLNNGEESRYYLRKFKSITTINDYEVYNLAFESNYYSDKVGQFVFNDDIDVSGLVDNLGRPLSELYITVNKKSNQEFSVIKSGLEFPYISELDGATYSNLSDINRIHNISNFNIESHIPLELDVENNGDVFYGDVVEYNNYDVEEVILGEVRHRFNTLNRDSVGRPEGYTYKPHHLIKIRQYSTFIEQGDISVYNLPSYAQDLGDGRYLWRDLLDIGYNDVNDTVLDYPFLNGCHYVYSNFILNLRRQDPFNLYNLYYKTLPRDIYGDKTDNKDYITNSGNNGC